MPHLGALLLLCVHPDVGLVAREAQKVWTNAFADCTEIGNQRRNGGNLGRPKSMTETNQLPSTEDLAMTESTQALVTAHDAFANKYRGHKVGNITVEPAADHYNVLLVDLPERENEAPRGIRALVNRKSGKVTEIKEVALEEGLNLTSVVPDSSISGRQAFDHALTALHGFENYGKEGRLTVEFREGEYRVTFPLPDTKKTGRGPEYAYEIWVNALTGQVVKILVAS